MKLSWQTRLALWLLRKSYPIRVDYAPEGRLEGVAFFDSQASKKTCVGHDMGDCASWKRCAEDYRSVEESVYAVLDQDFGILPWNAETRKYESLPDMIRRLAKEQFVSGVAKRP